MSRGVEIDKKLRKAAYFDYLTDGDVERQKLWCCEKKNQTKLTTIIFQRIARIFHQSRVSRNRDLQRSS